MLTVETRRLQARLLPELAVVLAVAWGLYLLLIETRGHGDTVLSFPNLLAQAGDKASYRVLWLVADTNEAQFYASVGAGATLLAGAFLAHRLDRRRSRWRGFPIATGTGLWPRLLAASVLGLAISVGLYGSILDRGEWIPTFVPFVSIPAGVVLVYGERWSTVLTGGVLGGLVGFPIAYAVIRLLLDPIGFPR